MSRISVPTIHDIARELNISASTVSRALGNHPRISQQTKEKITAMAHALGYRPNTLASNLRNKKSNTIGVVVPLINRHFFSSVISGIEGVAYQRGYTVIISQSNDLHDKEVNIVQSMLSNRVEGLIISIAMQTGSYEHLKHFRENNVPLVFFDRVVPEFECDKIVIDDFDSAFRVTQHLIDRGYKRVAHLAGPQNLQTYHLRKQGYLEALKSNGIPYDESLVEISKLTTEDGTSSAHHLSGLINPPDAYFCGNDTTALSVMIYLLERGHRIPTDIGIVGFSNEPFSKVVAPSISTIVQPGFEMGQRAAELIIAKIENSEKMFNTITLPADLIIRGSSDRKN